MKFDYFEYMNAIAVADLTGTQKSVAGAYARSYNPDRQDGLREESSKGIFRIAEETGYDDNTVSKARKHLLAKGWIVSQRRMGMSSLTACEIPAGFDYEAMKLAQDERVQSFNDSNNKRVRTQRKKKEASVGLVEEAVVSQEPAVIPAPENKTVGQDEAVLEPVKAVFAAPEPTENDCELTGHVKTIIGQSNNPELAEVYYRDAEFAPGDDEIKRAAKARSEADHDEHRFVTSYEDFDGETLVGYILRMKKSELTNA